MSTRQGSSSYTIVIGALAALLIGGIVLTFIVYPIFNAFTNSAFWGAETADGARLVMFIGGAWEFWGGIVLIALLAYVWITTRQ